MDSLYLIDKKINRLEEKVDKIDKQYVCLCCHEKCIGRVVKLEQDTRHIRNEMLELKRQLK